MYYTGVGSRKTPEGIIEYMKSLATWLEIHGYVLRTGDADGADAAFRNGCDRAKVYKAKDATEQAKQIASQFHPAWDKCSEFAKKLHARNAFQVLGDDLNTPSKFLVCWTPDGCESHEQRSINTGGTGTAISIASANNIPVFNLSNSLHIFYDYLVELWCAESGPFEPIKLKRASLYKTKNGLDVTAKSKDSIGMFFAPPWSLVSSYQNKQINEKEYEQEYKKVLDDLPPEVIKKLYDKHKGQGLTLLCYCHDNSFCHTHLIIKYLTTKYKNIFI